MKLCRTGMHNPFDVLIIASDGNCKGYLNKKNELLTYAERFKSSRFDDLAKSPKTILFVIPQSSYFTYL